ncbi:MAG TPA: response regulator transcription factor [Rhodothermales bacterium]|nr:response regulator transcription factor [Rhodothermales bacterium]
MSPYHTEHKITVWIVEDNRLYREVVTEILETEIEPEAIRAFGDCPSVLAAMQAGEIPDVMLLDIGLPQMSGLEGIGHFRQYAPQLPIIMLTIHQDNEKIFQAITLGASGYLLKSAEPHEIVASIRHVLQGGAAMDAQVARRVLDMFANRNAPRYDYDLSEREREILQGLVDGLTKNELATRFYLSPHTIDRHIRNVYAKLHVNNRGSAVAKALRERLI